MLVRILLALCGLIAAFAFGWSQGESAAKVDIVECMKRCEELFVSGTHENCAEYVRRFAACEAEQVLLDECKDTKDRAALACAKACGKRILF